MNKKLLSLVLTGLLLFTTSCSYSHASTWNIWTDDCGKTWSVIPVGQQIPQLKGICGYVVSLPDSPLTGDIDYKLNFANKVTAAIKSSFTYTIDDPVKYISVAKVLAKPNTTDSADDINSLTNRLELAETAIIDKVVREVAGTATIELDIATYDPQKLDDDILTKVNQALEPRGIKLDFVQNTVIPDQLTRAALDAVAAKRVMDSAKMGAVGDEILKAKAGSAVFNVNSCNSSNSTTNNTTNTTTSK